MDAKLKALFLKYLPRIYKDRAEPFPVRYIGCTLFTQPRRSGSFPKWKVDPAAEGAEKILEYAIYYDYDIQHLYDLEHIWVAVGSDGAVTDCWSSFHGMRLRAAGIKAFRLELTHPVLYSQPGKHAMLPDPELFGLHSQFLACCGEAAGGGLLIPGMLEGKMTTDPARDEAVRSHIRSRYSFVPTREYREEPISESQLITWPELLETIPELVEAQLRIIEGR